jgi:DNA anti-recombination protein RmuC
MSEENKTEIEFAGIRLTGGKIMLILPILSALGGALWGGFEFYKDYMDMKQQIQAYVAPDLSQFDKRLSMLDEKLIATQKSVDESNDYIKDIRTNVRSDIIEAAKGVDAIDRRTRELERDLRNQVNSLDRDNGVRMREMERDNAKMVKDLEKRVDDKIQKAWENPLAK